MAELPTFELERFFAKYEFTTPTLLCSSDLESLSVQDLLALPVNQGLPPDQGVDGLLATTLGYTESQGAPSLRAAIAATSQNCAAKDVLVLAGAAEGILLAIECALLLRSKEHPGARTVAVVQAPGYQSLYDVAARVPNVDLFLWGPTESSVTSSAVYDWSLEELDAIIAKAGGTIDLLVVNSPHNPTGHQFTRDEQARLIATAQAHNAFFFSDEVYRLLEHVDDSILPLACDLYHRAISLGVMSKSYGLAGLRLGWIVTRCPELMDACMAAHDFTTICTAAPSEYLSECALRRSEALLARSNTLLKRNLVLLDEFFARHRDIFNWERPPAGSVAFVQLREGNAAAFCEKLRVEAGVLLLPGTIMGRLPDPARFRLGFGRESLPEGLRKLDEILSQAK